MCEDSATVPKGQFGFTDIVRSIAPEVCQEHVHKWMQGQEKRKVEFPLGLLWVRKRNFQFPAQGRDRVIKSVELPC